MNNSNEEQKVISDDGTLKVGRMMVLLPNGDVRNLKKSPSRQLMEVAVCDNLDTNDMCLVDEDQKGWLDTPTHRASYKMMYGNVLVYSKLKLGQIALLDFKNNLLYSFEDWHKVKDR